MRPENIDQRQRRSVGRLVNSRIDPLQLHADSTGVLSVPGDMIKLVESNPQLQKYDRQHGEPRHSTSQDR